MENNHEFTATLDLSSCRHDVKSSDGVDALFQLKLALNAYGIEFSYETSDDSPSATIKLRHLDPAQAARTVHRNAGRKKLLTNTVSLDWLESHTVEEGMEALGNVSRRTYFRRLADLRKSSR